MCGETVALRVSTCLYCGEDLTGGRGQERSPDGGPSCKDAEPGPAVSVQGTILPRYIAATLDNVFAIILGITAAKAIEGDVPVIQVPLMAGTYLGYYLLSEGLASRTPGKMLTGLVVLQFDGCRCTWRQILIRTGFRFLEVNPILLGALPAAISILRSPHRQRIGDRWAGTIVVPSRRVGRG